MKVCIQFGLRAIVPTLFTLSALAQQPPESTKSNAENIKQIAKLTHGFEDLSIHLAYASFSPDGNTLAALYTWNYRGNFKDRVVLWDVTQKTKLAIIDLAPDYAFAISVVFSPDGKTLAVAHRDGVKVFDAKTREIRHQFRTKRLIEWDSPITISPDSQALTAITTSTEAPSEIDFFDLTSGRLRNTIKSDGEPLRRKKDGQAQGKSATYLHVTFSSDGKTMAASRDDKVQIWDAKTLTEIRSFAVHHGHHAAISPDGTLIAIATNGSNQYPGKHTFAVFDVATGEKRFDFGNFTPLPPPTFSPNGKLLIFGNPGPKARNIRNVGKLSYVPVQIINVETGKAVGSFEILSFSLWVATNGSLIAVTDDRETISLWDISALSK